MSNSVDEVAVHIKDIMALIIKANNITEGLYIPSMELSFGAGADKHPSGEVMPTVKIGIKSIGIQKVDKLDNEMVVDASVVNPKKRSSKMKSQ